MTCRRLRYSVLPLHQTLPVKPCRNSRPLRLEGKSGTLVVEDWVRVHFNWKSVSLTDCTQVLRELANAIVGPLLLIFEWSGRLRCSSRLEKKKIPLLKKTKKEDLGIYRLIASPKPLVMGWKRILLESISKR